MAQRLTPYLCCADAAAAITFYTTVFGAVETQRWTGDDGRIGHAELTVAGQALYLADEHPEIGVRSPASLGGTAVSLVLTVPDAGETMARAVAAGARVERPVTAQDDGSRSGWLLDPAGHRWNVETPGPQLSVDQLRDQVGGQYDVTG